MANVADLYNEDTMPIRSKLRALIRDEDLRREKLGLPPIHSDQELSQLTGLARTSIARLKNNRAKRIDLQTVEALMEFFGLKSIDELLEYIPRAQRKDRS